MSNKSDHNDNRVRVDQYLPEVNRSEINEVLFEGTINRHLTKDDTVQITGYVGQPNPLATQSRRLIEQDPHIDAFQLEPVVVTTSGVDKKVMTQSSFLSKLEMIGVDTSRLPTWGATEQFNWVPPINMDMLSHYYNYYWIGKDNTDLPQYFTIENRCNKARTRTEVYKIVVRQHGDSIALHSIDAVNNTFTIAGQIDDVFTERFVFDVTSSDSRNFVNKVWTVRATEVVDGYTIITPEENIAIHSATAPATTKIGQWWVNANTNQLQEWTGTDWVNTSDQINAQASLQLQLERYQQAESCACNQQSGWDVAAWDDNQLGSVVWNDALLDQISFLTEADWLAANGAPSESSLWYDLSTDTLRVWSITDSNWKITVEPFSQLLHSTTGREAWDYTFGCIAQQETPWATQNRWIHKTQVGSLVGARRAQVPILEYDSNLELNQWVKNVYVWKYRADISTGFSAKGTSPSRLELEPVKEFEVKQLASGWNVYLYSSTQQAQQNIDYTDIFRPGFTFRITDDTGTSMVLEVKSSQYRQTSALVDPAAVVDGSFVTVVELSQLVYTGPLSGGGAAHTRIEPVLTSTGDPWRGYHVHWVLDTAQTYMVPCAPQPQDLVPPPAPVLTVTPQGNMYLGEKFQELTLSSPQTTILLDQSLRYNALNKSQVYAGNSSECRVYINGIRQVGNYTELTTSEQVDYVVVGNSVYTATDDLSPSFTAIYGVEFAVPVAENSIVRIDVGPSARSDYGTVAVPVRTIEDEDEFAVAVAYKQQPALTSLPVYSKMEQVKAAVNQYPLFNVYDIITGEVTAAVPLFAYTESSTSAIDNNTQRRIVSMDQGRDFEFTQTLVDGVVTRAYKLVGADPHIWYNPVTNKASYWDGITYSAKMNSTGSDALEHITAITCSATEPLSLYDADGALWLNTITYTIYKRNAPSSVWIAQPFTVRVSDTDPLLQTIWKKGTVEDTYVPAYVSRDKTPVAIGTDDGSWETLHPWYYNTEHDNYSTITYSQMVAHFTAILKGQPIVPALLGGGIYSYSQAEIDYGVMGTIREHNNSFDTLMSAMNNPTTSPLGVIEFAHDQYESALLTVMRISEGLMASVVASTSPKSVSDIISPLASQTISAYEQNDFTFRLYGDGVSYTSDGRGIRNWVSTLPLLGLSKPTKPHLTVASGGVAHLMHHDGHRSSVSLSASVKDALSRQLAQYVTASGQPVGIISAQLPPTTVDGIAAALGDVTIGKLWYTVQGSTRRLYQLQGVAISDTAPSTTGIPVGAKYYNTALDQMYANVGGVWSAIPGTANDISEMWVPLNISEIVAGVVLAVEQRLYDASIGVSPKVSTFPTAAEDEPLRENYTKERFLSYAQAADVQSPYANTTYNATDPFTWNYMFSNILTPPRVGAGAVKQHAAWQAIYNEWYGTPYPHLEPWILQGYTDKPDWWDDEYLNDDVQTYGNRRWKYIHATHTGMWANVLAGVIPPGRATPRSTPPTYNYVPVNIDDVATSASGYQPDDLLPPYFNTTGVATAVDVRSMFSNYNADIVSPSSDYSFGATGPVEWAWRSSAQYAYDNLIVEFLLEPMKFMHHTFGPDFVYVGGLNIDKSTQGVYSHKNAVFHSDAIDTSTTASVRGINQWYVCHSRYSGFDTAGILRNVWAEWTPKLAYQMSGISDTSTFRISNKFFDLTDKDYSVDLVKDASVKELWVDAFNVDVLSIPPAIRQYNNESSWRFSVSTLAPVSRIVSVFPVMRYPVHITAGNDVITVYEYPITQVSASGKWIGVAHDQQHIFNIGDSLDVTASSGGNGTYTVRAVSYDSTANTTRITVNETVSALMDGVITPTARRATTWSLGDAVLVSSTKNLPHPLRPGVPYYIIPVDDYNFKLAETFNDAVSGSSITFTTTEKSAISVGKVKSTFRVYGGESSSGSTDTWVHYEVDTREPISVRMPVTVNGIQSLIDLFDGYESYMASTGVVYNYGDHSEYDPITGRLIGWQSEIERFIDWAFRLRQTNIKLSDRFEIRVHNLSTDEMIFTSATPSWPAGTRVLLSTTGSLPTNVDTMTEYYYYPTGTNTFKISLYNTVPNVPVDIDTTGSGRLFVAQANGQVIYPSFEVNPSRNQLVLRTPTGIVSNVLQTAFADVRINQTLFDQYGRPLTQDKLVVYRQDLETRISVVREIPNDVHPQIPGLEDVYNYIHVGGGHIILDAYQHVVIFNNRTGDGSYVYEPFVGINVRRFNMDYFETSNYTLRPTIGGHYLLDNKFYRNMEGTMSDMQTYYSAYDQVSQTAASKSSQAMLDYHGTIDYLNDINVTPSAQFTFYRGLIQAKGSSSSIDAYINSRRFVDANVDEYWAQKIATFGDSRPKVYPEVKLTANDSTLDDIRLLFAANNDELLSSDADALREKGFEIIEKGSQTRFADQPDQSTDLFIDAVPVSSVSLYVGPTAPVSASVSTKMDLTWINTTNLTINEFNGSVWSVVNPHSQVKIVSSSIVVHLGTSTDAVKLVTHSPTADVHWAGDFSSVKTYVVNDAVTYNGLPYVCIQTSSGQLPTNTSYWEPLVLTVDSYNTTMYDLSGGGYFKRVNSEVVSLSVDQMKGLNNSAGVIVKLYGMRTDPDTTSPARLVDTISKTVVASIPLWDPARNIHYYNAIHSVDVMGPDPAQYEVSPVQQSTSSWGKEEVGTVWVDAGNVSYVPYYDDAIFPNVTDRLRRWGRLAEWASMDVYKWVESAIHPSNWDAAVQSGTEIRPGVRATGTAKKSTFYKTRTPVTGISANGTGGLRVPKGSFALYDTIILTSIQSSQSLLSLNTPYTVTAVDTSSATYDTLTLSESSDAININVSISGVVAVKGFDSIQWTKDYTTTQRFVSSMYTYTTVVTLDNTKPWKPGDEVEVYVNGTRVVADSITIQSNYSITLPVSIGYPSSSFVDVVKRVHVVTEDEDAAATGDDDGTLLRVWSGIYEYSTAVEGTATGTRNMYYFWVKDETTRSAASGHMSAYDVSQQLVKIPVPYMVHQIPMNDPTLADAYGYGVNEYGNIFSQSDLAEQYLNVPVFYRAVILRGLSSYINGDDRYIVRFTRDKTLRYQPSKGTNHVSLKQKHEEWVLFRRRQLGTVSRDLWDRATEAMIGHKLGQPEIRVPALNRTLYDDVYGTDTQYGLGSGQAFVNKDLAITTLKSFLMDPTKNFYPIDIDFFLSQHALDTAADIEAAMGEIYDTLGSLVVNDLWFELLQDALTTKKNHKELMKTSWIALHGIRILDVGGMFDD